MLAPTITDTTGPLFLGELTAAFAATFDAQVHRANSYATGGTGSAYTLTPTPPLAANAARVRYDGVTASVAGTGTPTLSISGNPAQPLMAVNSAGALVSYLPGLNQIFDVQSDGTNWVVLDPLPTPGTGRLLGIQFITASSTYTKATNNPSFIVVEVIGGGGQAGGGNGQTYIGGQGGPGGYSRMVIPSASLLSSETITLGVGGSGAGYTSPGTAGGTSSFGSHCSATGGSGGAAASSSGNGSAGACGNGVGGNLNIYGGAYVISNRGITPVAGAAPANSGYGGSGASATTAGYAGGSGYMIIYEYA